jgi:hypothetical protein
VAKAKAPASASVEKRMKSSLDEPNLLVVMGTRLTVFSGLSKARLRLSQAAPRPTVR